MQTVKILLILLKTYLQTKKLTDAFVKRPLFVIHSLIIWQVQFLEPTFTKARSVATWRNRRDKHSCEFFYGVSMLSQRLPRMSGLSNSQFTPIFMSF